MSKKIRIIVTDIIEYEPKPEFYKEGCTIEEMAQIDAHTDDITALMNDDNTSMNIKWQVIDENNEIISEGK